MSTTFIAIAISAIIALIILPILIPVLRKLKAGQPILTAYLPGHAGKSGTPPMGGIAFIISSVVASIVIVLVKFGPRWDIFIPILTALAYSLIGFTDDFLKIIYKENKKGLSAKAKSGCQLLVAIVSTVLLYNLGFLNGEIVIPFMSHTVDIGFFIIPLIVLVHLSVTNSVNLTDGIDGLATSVTIVVSLFFTVVALLADAPIAIFIGALLGGCIAFLLFNAHPAKVFMGDTGSMFLGGAIAVTATYLKMPLILIIAGGIFLWETLSVILQVTSFKLTGKRIFKITPFHHHLEKCDYSENKICLIFSLTSVVLCLISYLGIMNIL